jgi:uncharacterized membrane protein YphA (DoxX/SURF4 family)
LELSWLFSALLFSEFPRGAAAAGLLLLRAAIGCTAIFQGWAYLTGLDFPSIWTVPAGTFLILSGAALIIGLLTAVACAAITISALGTVLSWLPAPTPNLYCEALSSALAIVISVAVGLLGPGSWSIDARLFGRREITIPRMPRRPQI